MDLTYDPAIPLLGIYPKEPKTLIPKNIKSMNTPIFSSVSFTLARICKQPKCASVDEWKNQLWDVYTMEFYLAVKKKILSFATVRMELENIMLSQIS